MALDAGAGLQGVRCFRLPLLPRVLLRLLLRLLRGAGIAAPRPSVQAGLQRRVDDDAGRVPGGNGCMRHHAGTAAALPAAKQREVHHFTMIL